MATPLMIGPAERKALEELRTAALANPIHVPDLFVQLQTQQGELAHRATMNKQSVVIPWPVDFLVCFSIETGHPCGVARHMSMSVQREGRVPRKEAAWIVAGILGFTGTMMDCAVWLEDISGPRRKALNIVQAIAADHPAGHA